MAAETAGDFIRSIPDLVNQKAAHLQNQAFQVAAQGDQTGAEALLRQSHLASEGVKMLTDILPTINLLAYITDREEIALPTAPIQELTTPFVTETTNPTEGEPFLALPIVDLTDKELKYATIAIQPHRYNNPHKGGILLGLKARSDAISAKLYAAASISEEDIPPYLREVVNSLRQIPEFANATMTQLAQLMAGEMMPVSSGETDSEKTPIELQKMEQAAINLFSRNGTDHAPAPTTPTVQAEGKRSQRKEVDREKTKAEKILYSYFELNEEGTSYRYQSTRNIVTAISGHQPSDEQFESAYNSTYSSRNLLLIRLKTYLNNPADTRKKVDLEEFVDYISNHPVYGLHFLATSQPMIFIRSIIDRTVTIEGLIESQKFLTASPKSIEAVAMGSA